MNNESKFLIGIGIATLVIIVAGVLFFGQKKPDLAKDEAGVKQVDQSSLIADAKHTIGKADAPVSIVEFGDFQCPACGAAHPIVKTGLEKNKDRVYFVFRHFPLPVHKNARDAAKAAEAVGVQGKFFEMHDTLYERQKEWESLANPKETFEKYASEIGLDVAKFKEDFENGTQNISTDYALGSRSGVDATPTFFINGQKYTGVISENQLQAIIDRY